MQVIIKPYVWSDGTPAKSISCGKAEIAIAQGRWSIGEEGSPWLEPDDLLDLVSCIARALEELDQTSKR